MLEVCSAEGRIRGITGGSTEMRRQREKLGSVRRLDLKWTKLNMRGVRRKEIGAVNCASAEPERTKQVHIRNSKVAMPVER